LSPWRWSSRRCRANRKLGLLPADKAEAIDRACGLIIRGQYHEQFVVDVIQGGAGTSTNSCSLGHVAAPPAQGSRHDLLRPAGSPDPVKSSNVR
jgi:fumarate hydratase class II